MKKLNILLALALSFGFTGCYDLDKMPEGVLSTTNPFQSIGEYETMWTAIMKADCWDKASWQVVAEVSPDRITTATT